MKAEREADMGMAVRCGSLRRAADIASARNRIGNYLARIAIEHGLDDAEMTSILVAELQDWSHFRE